ncbi:UNVERIFIED_ORG: hypothetical protein B2H98_06050 [Clostridium botulinum]
MNTKYNNPKGETCFSFIYLLILFIILSIILSIICVYNIIHGGNIIVILESEEYKKGEVLF